MGKRTKAIKITDQNKAWNRRKTRMNPYLIAQREKSKTFLIICEGENTEPEYFKAFPVKTATIKSYGLGSSKSKLVEYVLEIIEHETDEDQEVWIVFDMDLKLQDDIDKQKEDYENAISTATAAGLKVAHSNDSFELW
ncbi:MAG: RloB family protein, partial [Bacteroidota bacterium]